MPENALIRGLIDGVEANIPKGTTILAAARALGIGIPTLCHHEGLPAEGGCRLCLVESGGKLVASCQYPLRAGGFDIETASPKVKKARAFVAALMLARAPNSKIVHDLARAHGLEPDERFQREPADECLRCGLCVRACAAQGGEAVSLIGRGAGRKVAGPFLKPPADCFGCLACVRVCPTGVIKFREDETGRSVWGRDFDLIPCPACGKPRGTAEELSLAGADPLCPSCRRRAMAGALGAVPAPAAAEISPRGQ